MRRNSSYDTEHSTADEYAVVIGSGAPKNWERPTTNVTTLSKLHFYVGSTYDMTTTYGKHQTIFFNHKEYFS